MQNEVIDIKLVFMPRSVFTSPSLPRNEWFNLKFMILNCHKAILDLAI